MAIYDRGKRSTGFFSGVGRRSGFGGGNSVTVKIEGLADLGAALKDLPKSLERTAMRRALQAAGQVIADRAQELAPRLTGKLATSITVSTKAKNSAGASAYALTLKEGGSRAEASLAFKEATRGIKLGAADVQVYVGPSDVPYAPLVEFGTYRTTAKPFMRPAWDEMKGNALSIVQDQLKVEVDRAVQKVARKALRDAKRAAS